MKKKLLLAWLLGLVLALTVLFLVTKSYTAVTWITTVFTVLAFGTHGYIWNKTNLSDPNQAFLSYPGAMVSAGHLVFQLIVCIVLGFLSETISIRLALLINLIPLIIVWILILTTDIGKEHIRHVDSRRKDHHTEL